MKIWIDADACPKPVKEIVFKASGRLQVEVILVSNGSMWIPIDPLISLVVVEDGMDVADKYIEENVQENDLVITQDVPLASKVVENGAIAIDPKGEIIDKENARSRLSIRDFMTDLRSSGVNTGGPKPYSQNDKIKFANSFNKTITSLMKSG